MTTTNATLNDDPDLKRLLPCPFCGGGESMFQSNGSVWTGMAYSDPISVSVRHWCKDVAGQPNRMIERIGKDKESAIKQWNIRVGWIDIDMKVENMRTALQLVADQLGPDHELSKIANDVLDGHGQLALLSFMMRNKKELGKV